MPDPRVIHESRRRFLGITASLVAGLLLPRRASAAVAATAARGGPHPKPRPGITAAKLLSAEQMKGRAAEDAYEAVRAIPEVVDGIRCHCGCAELPGYYSLLSCYEGAEAMALSCPICQGEGRMAARLHKDGKSLDEIRQALDAKYG